LPDDIRRDNPLVDPAKKTTTVVYRLVDGKAICTPVKRGASDDTHSVVTAGLNENDVVVVGPFKVLEKLKHDELIQDEKTVKADDKTVTARGEDSKSDAKVEVEIAR
jgi:hypothetical protein